MEQLQARQCWLLLDMEGGAQAWALVPRTPWVPFREALWRAARRPGCGAKSPPWHDKHDFKTWNGLGSEEPGAVLVTWRPHPILSWCSLEQGRGVGVLKLPLELPRQVYRIITGAWCGECLHMICIRFAHE